MKYNFVQKFLSARFTELGQTIAKQPCYFIFLPILLSAILSTGFLRIQFNRDFEHLFSTETGKASHNKKIVDTLFPSNTSKHIDIFRLSSAPPGLMITILSKDGKNMLREEVFNELHEIDNIAHKLKVPWKERIITYKDVCAIKEHECYRNPIFKWSKHIKDYIDRKRFLKFPFEIDPLTLLFTAHPINLGGVTTDENSYVKEVKALRLFYLIENRLEPNKEMASVWELSLAKTLEEMHFKYLDVSCMPSTMFASEMEYFSNSILPMTAIVGITVAIFSMITSISVIPVRSKPWLGVGGCVSAGLAIVATFGFVFHCGVPYTDIHIVLPFLILGTEIDDAYVLIASWRKTNPNDPVEKRMGDAYSEAAVSITITSITNLFAFCFGIVAPFPIVRIFCIYAAIAIFFTYFYQITFFGGCMALSGLREKNYLHPFTLHPLKYKEDSQKEEILAKTFRDKIGHLLTYNSSKVAVLIIFTINLTVGVYGFLIMNTGMEVRDVLTAEKAENVRLYYKYFSQYPASLHVVVNRTLNYSDPKTQELIEETLQRFEAHPNVAKSSVRLSWIKYYKEFRNLFVAKYLLHGYNLSVEEEYVSSVKDVYLKFPPAWQFVEDIIFNNDSTRIIATRFLLLLKDLTSRDTENKAIHELQEIAESSPLPVTTHSLFFPIMEHGLLIKEIVIQVAWLSALLIIAVFFIFVPNITCALCISVAVFASLCETIGYMAIWKVKLDMISMIILIMSIGFSINYPTHISFAYMMSKKKEQNQKLKDSLYDVGLPIFQGTVSTILAVIIFAFERAPMFIVFFKVVFLLSIHTAFHAMFFMPVALSIVQRFHKSKTCSKTKELPKYTPFTYDDTLYLKLMKKPNIYRKPSLNDSGVSITDIKEDKIDSV